MKMPSKVISYRESSISRYARVLIRLREREYEPMELYKDMKNVFDGIDDYMDVLDGLYALRAIEFNDNRGTISYVETDLQ